MFISLLIEQGAHQKYIQEQAGHSIQVTMVTYGHLFRIGIEAGRISENDAPKETNLAPSAHPALKTADVGIYNYA
jgi:hypothetical protein